MTAGALVLAFSSLAIDAAITEPWLRRHDWFYTGNAEGASAVLQAIAGSMITLAGLVFSLTLVALTLASSQFGPRLLRSFMRDVRNQVVLGTFVATFLYSLLVLLAIRHGEADRFVPHLSVTFGVVLAVASLAVLIYFVHHVSTSIHADELAAAVGRDLVQAIDRLCPLGAPPASDRPGELPVHFDREARCIPSAGDGYLQIVDVGALVALAARHGLVLRLERAPGQYAIEGSAILSAWPASAVSDEAADALASAFVLGNQRTPEQDVEYPIHQLVEIAVRALSPGINDPFTALACVDHLSSGLSRLARREMPALWHADESGRLRVVMRRLDFTQAVGAAFDQIREYGRTSAAVTIHLLEAIAAIAPFAVRDGDRDALRRQARMIERGARDALPEANDRQRVEAALQAALSRLCLTRE